MDLHENKHEILAVKQSGKPHTCNSGENNIVVSFNARCQNSLLATRQPGRWWRQVDNRREDGVGRVTGCVDVCVEWTELEMMGGRI